MDLTRAQVKVLAAGFVIALWTHLALVWEWQAWWEVGWWDVINLVIVGGYVGVLRALYRATH